MQIGLLSPTKNRLPPGHAPLAERHLVDVRRDQLGADLLAGDKRGYGACSTGPSGRCVQTHIRSGSERQACLSVFFLSFFFLAVAFPLVTLVKPGRMRPRGPLIRNAPISISERGQGGRPQTSPR